MIAIMGPSGGGKSTLLSVLTGRLKKGLSGELFINGTLASRSTIKKISGFVAQEDALHAVLTVKQSLFFAAVLRLGDSLSENDISEIVQEVIQDLGLSRCSDTIIGNFLFRGLSGGEKRRVSVGMELVAQPSLLFLDEPTSGLDSKSARYLIEILKSLTTKGKTTVLCSIHQPSSYVFALFDKVSLLSKGNPVFYGSIPKAIEFFKSNGLKLPRHANPSDFFINSINTNFESEEEEKATVDKLVTAFKNSKYASKIEEQIEKDQKSPKKFEISMNKEAGFFTQFWYIAYRLLLVWSKDPIVFGVRAFLFMFIAIVEGTIFLRIPWKQEHFQDRFAALMASATFLMYFTIVSIPAFMEEKEIFLKERMNRYFKSFYL
eukprot:TRINITY_DN5875_c0_g1_i2.p1 TRINITY_DN5875_c0_g1~~TRINITY_DN5875_c0_g1_i2.p1  ORF type:complete len:438 (-),score=72.01 TRINITY_DN5875_c0_g1_i2:922-2049(-)